MNLLAAATERRKVKPLYFLYLGICLGLHLQSSQADSFWIANINISFQVGNRTVWEIAENGVFAKASPLKKVSGIVIAPEEPHQNACSSVTNFKSGNAGCWIALIIRGQCSFTKKISVAAEKGAVGVIIYNYPGTGNNVFPMLNFGKEGPVSVMIGNLKGTDLLHLIQNGIQVMATIDVGKHCNPWLTRYMGTIFILSSVAVAYCTFYCAGKLRRTRNLIQRCQQELDITKAINRLELRTLKEDDKEVGSNGDNCAVCLEMYKPKDVARILRCGHLFHKICVDPWLLKHQTCPVCKWNMLGNVERITATAEPFGIQLSNEASSAINSPNEAICPEAPAGIHKGSKAQSGDK
ncbi:RING finger protein 148-like [Pseudonaja textilis]|uniref:RING finger protein 148-like n=1 Tax=Pseudonaja textilis TaxID=8673 RepID=UPI000EA93388|nr:RING finger protein 148-like [Pseudonaja textilis]